MRTLLLLLLTAAGFTIGAFIAGCSASQLASVESALGLPTPTATATAAAQ